MMRINGVEAEQLPATDRGLHYGDGLFETIAVRNQTPEYWSEHLQRLQRGCERLNIPMPEVDWLKHEADTIIQQTAEQKGVLKIILTRGSGGRGYLPAEDVQPTTILQWKPWPYPADKQKKAEAQGVQLHLCRSRLSENRQLAGIKHLNRLEQVMARSEWQDPEIAEGVVMNQRDELIEGTMSNLFMVVDGEVITPTLDRCGVEGVMRNQIIQQLNKHGITVTAQAIPRHILENAEELFCSNSLIGIWPVASVGKYQFSAPGPVTSNCIQWMKQGS